jgi:hypothetical protein
MTKPRAFRLFGAAGPPITMTLVALGIALRVWHFGANYSLNHDDICLALNVIDRSARGLMHTLDFDQAAPLGFLWIEHAMVGLLGPGARALRLLPLLFGCVSVVLIARLAENLVPPFEAIAVVGFFSFSQALIESSIRVKPYSLDQLVTIMVVIACLPLMSDAVRPRQTFAAAAAGTIALWFSFPALFLLGGMGLAIVAAAIADRAGARMRRLLPVFGPWAISAAAALWFSMRPGLTNTNLVRVDSDFMFPLRLPARLVPWITEATLNLGSISTSVRLAPFAAVALLLAIALIIRRRDRLGCFLAAPLALCLAGAIAQKYPWLPRLLFFLVPLTLLITMREVGGMVRERSRTLRIVAASIAGLALIYSGASAVKNIVVEGNSFDDPRGAVAAIAADWQPGDRIYASGAAMPCLIYYRRILQAKGLDFVSSRKRKFVPNQVIRTVPLPKTDGRLWFMYFEPGERGFDRAILAKFDQPGTLISTSRHKHFVVALWDLRAKSKAPP